MRDSEICLCCEGIWRFKIPFENLYTSVFLIQTEQTNILVDCATNAYDVDTYILPALQTSGLDISDINYLILTHSHADHAGGKERILEHNPKIVVVQNGFSFSVDGLNVVELKGHTLDCIGVFDERTGTLIAGDGLQGGGVGKYRCSLESKEEYLRTIKKIQEDTRVQNLLFSHAYEPWNKDFAYSRQEVEEFLQKCLKAITIY